MGITTSFGITREKLKRYYKCFKLLRTANRQQAQLAKLLRSTMDTAGVNSASDFLNVGNS
jgi:hypothetical protein